VSKEFRIQHQQISNSQTITPEMEKEFEKRGLDLHLHDVVSLEDDFTTKERVLKVKNTKYFFT
jgi:hypothetical protein